MIGHLTNYTGIQPWDPEIFDLMHGNELFNNIVYERYLWNPYYIELLKSGKRWFKCHYISSKNVNVCENLKYKLSEERHSIDNIGIILGNGVDDALLAIFNFHKNQPSNDMSCIKELKIIGHFSTKNIPSIPNYDPIVQIRHIKKVGDDYELGYVHYNHIRADTYSCNSFIGNVRNPFNRACYEVPAYYYFITDNSSGYEKYPFHRFLLHEIPIASK